MTSRNITKLFQVFPFKEVSSVRKLAWVPITLSFLFTWLSLVSSLLNQSLVTYHWLNPEITSGIHCNSAQESSPVDCRAISVNEHFNGSSSPLCLRLCSPSHHALAHFYPHLRGNRVLQITFPWLKHQIRFYNWKNELQSTICVTSSVKKKKKNKQPAIIGWPTPSDTATHCFAGFTFSQSKDPLRLKG